MDKLSTTKLKLNYPRIRGGGKYPYYAHIISATGTPRSGCLITGGIYPVEDFTCARGNLCQLGGIVEHDSSCVTTRPDTLFSISSEYNDHDN